MKLESFQAAPIPFSTRVPQLGLIDFAENRDFLCMFPVLEWALGWQESRLTGQSEMLGQFENQVLCTLFFVLGTLSVVVRVSFPEAWDLRSVFWDFT